MKPSFLPQFNSSARSVTCNTSKFCDSCPSMNDRPSTGLEEYIHQRWKRKRCMRQEHLGSKTAGITTPGKSVHVSGTGMKWPHVLSHFAGITRAKKCYAIDINMIPRSRFQLTWLTHVIYWSWSLRQWGSIDRSSPLHYHDNCHLRHLAVKKSARWQVVQNTGVRVVSNPLLRDVRNICRLFSKRITQRELPLAFKIRLSEMLKTIWKRKFFFFQTQQCKVFLDWWALRRKVRYLSGIVLDLQALCQCH